MRNCHLFSAVVVVAALASTFPLGRCEVAAAVLRVPEQHRTIQDAIDKAAPGDVVEVGAGTYKERLVLKPQIVLRSAGDDAAGEVGLKRAAATIIDLGGEAADAPGVTMAEDATLDGFTITGVGRYDEAKWKEHYETRGEKQDHAHIGVFTGPAIGIRGVTCTVVHCLVHHNGSTGIALRGEKDKVCEPLIRENVCYRNMGGGIGAMNGCGGRIIANRCYQNFYAGIGHAGGHPNVVENVCYENIRAGIGISEGACPTVRGNKCYRNRRAGIGIRTGEATQPVVVDNECYENGMAGIGNKEQARPIIRGNFCHHNEMAGIGTREGAAPIIVGNRCEQNKMAGIGSRDGAHPLIQGNTCKENATAGIGVRGKETVATIRENRCEENKLVAIGLPDGAAAFIENNFCVRTGGVPPLVAVKGGSTATLKGNTFRGGGVAGVLVEGSAVLLDNRLQQAGDIHGTGVWVWKESSLAAIDNAVDGYANGINAAGSAVVAADNRFRRYNAAIRVSDSTSPAHVYGNTAEDAGKPAAQVFAVQGTTGIVAENKLIPPQKDSP